MNVVKVRTLRDRFRDAYNAFRGKKIGNVQLGIEVKQCDKCERGTEVLYLCNHEICGDKCHYQDCNHTTDIRYAKNFEKIGDCYWEKEVLNNAEMDTPVET